MDTQSATVVQPTEIVLDTEQSELIALISDREQERSFVKNRRESRDHEVDVDAMRASHEINDNETYIPIRRCESTISISKPALLNYLFSSKRIILFKDLNDPFASHEDHEIAFANVCRHSTWKLPWELLIDGTLEHGGDFIEIAFDPKLPCGFSVEYVSRADILMPKCTESLSELQRIGRVFNKTIFELKTDPRFDQAFVTEKTSNKKSYEKLEIVRMWVKHEGALWEYWLFLDDRNRFLSEPVPVDLGLFEIDETSGSIALVPKPPEDPTAPVDPMAQPEMTPVAAKVTEFPLFFNKLQNLDLELLSIRGLVYASLPCQEAETETWSAHINRTIKSSYIFASATNPDGSPNTSVELKRDTIIGAAVNFFSPPPANPENLNAARALSTELLNMSGQTNFATMARKDSRKTKEEIVQSSDTQAAISGNYITPLAQTILDVYTLGYQIFKSQVLAENLFYTHTPELSAVYNYLPAGDVDVAEREQKKQIVREMLPQLQNTAVGPIMLQMMLESFLPTEAPKLIAKMQEQNQTETQLKAMANIVANLPIEMIPPEQQQQFLTIQNVAKQLIGAPPAAPQGMAG